MSFPIYFRISPGGNGVGVLVGVSVSVGPAFSIVCGVIVEAREPKYILGGLKGGVGVDANEGLFGV